MLPLTGIGQEENDICPQGPVEIKQAGGTWFISIAGGEWEYVGQQWEAVEELIAGTPIETVFNQQRALSYIGSTLSIILGVGSFFWPSQLCVFDQETGIKCQGGLRAILSPLATGLGIYWFLKVEESTHVAAIDAYNEMWKLICSK